MFGGGLLQRYSQGDSEAVEIVNFPKIPLPMQHTQFLDSAMVWGSSAKHARGQKVGLDHLLEDEDGEPNGSTYPPGTTDTFVVVHIAKK